MYGYSSRLSCDMVHVNENIIACDSYALTDDFDQSLAENFRAGKLPDEGAIDYPHGDDHGISEGLSSALKSTGELTIHLERLRILDNIRDLIDTSEMAGIVGTRDALMRALVVCASELSGAHNVLPFGPVGPDL